MTELKTELKTAEQNVVQNLKKNGYYVIVEDYAGLLLSIRKDGNIVDVQIDYDENGYIVNYLENEEPTSENTITLENTVKFINSLI